MKLIHVIILLTIITGCESIVDFPEVPQTSEYPVIEAILTDQNEVQKVRVSCTTSLEDSVSSHPVSDAKVYVCSDTGDTAVYHYTDNGWYASAPYQAMPGKTYKLTVNINKVDFSATGSLIAMNGIDSLYTKRLPKENKDSAYFVLVDGGPVNPNDTKYYQIDVYRNDSLLTDGINLAVFNDKYLTALRGINLPFAFAQNDTVDMVLYSISENMFNYYESLSVNIFSLSFVNSGYRTNPPQMFSKFTGGYFQVSAVDKKRMIIR
jgi:hypothetical protein